MKNICKKLAVASSGVVISLGSLTLAMPAQAVLMRYDFSVTNIDGGIHDGTTGAGYFTFDSEGEELDLGSGEVIKQVLDFEFNWLGQTFGVETLDFDNDGDGVLFVDGVFQSLDWDYVADANLSWDLFENEFEYTDLSGSPNVSGYGEVSYEKQISDVPEPGVVIGLGLVGLGFCLNKKKLSDL